MNPATTSTAKFRVCEDVNGRFWDDLLRAAIARDLREKYEDTLAQPPPERLTTLITELERRIAHGVASHGTETNDAFHRQSVP